MWMVKRKLILQNNILVAIYEAKSENNFLGFGILFLNPCKQAINHIIIFFWQTVSFSFFCL
jgi:hypothetical protein